MTQLDEAMKLLRNIQDGIGALLPDADALRAIVDLAQNKETQIDDSISEGTWYRLRDLVTAVETLEKAWTHRPQAFARLATPAETEAFKAAHPLTFAWNEQEKNK